MQQLTVISEVLDRTCLIVVAAAAILFIIIRKVVISRHKNKIERKLKTKLVRLTQEADTAMQLNKEIAAELLKSM